MRQLWLGVALAILALATLLWTQRPYRLELARYRTSLAERTPEQRANLAAGAARLEGARLEPGQVWSFNRHLGPRTPERGYRLAAAFLEQDVTRSVGGGLCQLSSTLYDAALAAGLTIVERHAHQRRVHSVPPGYDAAVWYGKTDLRLTNPTRQAIRASARLVDEGLEVSLWGSERVAGSIRVWAETAPGTPDELRVRVWRALEGQPQLVSADRYPPER